MMINSIVLMIVGFLMATPVDLILAASHANYLINLLWYPLDLTEWRLY